MKKYWLIFAEANGDLIVEQHGGRWEFVPTDKVGRPQKKKDEDVQPTCSLLTGMVKGMRIKGIRVVEK